MTGILFAAGWWIFIDGFSYADRNQSNAGPFYMYLPGIFATIGLFILNNIRKEVFAQETTNEDILWWEKLLLIVAVIFHLASIIESIWVFCGKHIDKQSNAIKWRGISTIIQSILITLASFGWRFLWYDPDGSY